MSYCQCLEDETVYAQATFISPRLSEKPLAESSWLNVLGEKQWFQRGHGLENMESDEHSFCSKGFLQQEMLV